VGDHLETFCAPQAGFRVSGFRVFYPEVPAGELESGKVIDPWNPEQGRTT
jgi:hypothetical protein